MFVRILIPAPADGGASIVSEYVCDMVSRLKEKIWTSELVLVDISGRINSFLVSLTGYQVRESSMFRVYFSKMQCKGSEVPGSQYPR
jgi:hypothetical protein